MSKPRNNTSAKSGGQNSPKYTGKVNDTANAPEQPKGREFRYVTNEVYHRSPDRSAKDVMTYKEAMQAAESVYWPNRARLYDLYDDNMKLDGFMVGIIEKQIDKILNKTLLYKKGEKPIYEMDALINSEPFRDMCKEILYTRFWGLTGLEFIPGDTFRWNPIDRKHIKPKWRKITWEQTGNEGMSYDDYWNLWIMGKPNDLGLFVICSYYGLLKRGVISSWAEYVEMFGIPTTVMKYEAYDEQTRDELKKIIKETGSSLRLVIPKQADHEIKEARNTGNGDVQNSFRQMANEEMAVLIEGATETTTSNAKSGGHTQSSTHAEESKEKIKSLMKSLANMLNEPVFINILKNYGYPVVDGGMFQFDREIDVDYMNKKYKIDSEWADKGLDIPTKYIYKTYAIDEPAAGEPLLKVPGATGNDDQEPDHEETGGDGAPAPRPRSKPKARGTTKPLSHSKLRNLYSALSDFFAQALH